MVVSTAADGEGALVALDASPIDVVLTDLRLPVRGGMSLLEALSDRPVPTAAVVMTGYGTIETATQALKMGASDYLLKPVRLRDVHEALVTAVAEQRLRLAREHAHRLNLLYERLLGLAGPVSADDLLVRLCATAVEESGAEACRCSVYEGGRWRRVAGPPDSSLPLALRIDSGGGQRAGDVAIELLGALPLPEPGLVRRLEHLSVATARVLVEAGVGDLPTVA